MTPQQDKQPSPPPERQVGASWYEKHSLRSFEGEIRDQEDLLFGVALFFEALQFMHAGQNAVIETYRKELRNALQSGRQSIEQARQLLDAARLDSSKSRAVQEFRFEALQGSVRPEELKQRSQIFLQAYQEAFPRRSRTAPLTQDEIVRLINRSAEKMPW